MKSAHRGLRKDRCNGSNAIRAVNRYGRGSSCGFTSELCAPADHPIASLIPLAPSDEHTKLGFCSGGAAMRLLAQVYQYNLQKPEKPLRSCFQVFCAVFFHIWTLPIVRASCSGWFFFCPVLNLNLLDTIWNNNYFLSTIICLIYC